MRLRRSWRHSSARHPGRPASQWRRECLRHATVVLLFLIGGTAYAQPGNAAAMSWLERLAVKPVAGIALRPVSPSFNGSSESTELGLMLHIGLRTQPVALLCKDAHGLCRAFSKVILTPHLAYGATHLRGMNPATDSYAYSSREFALKLAYPLARHLVPTILLRRGSHTAERLENGEIVNLWGNGTSAGVGFEIPITPRGRGIEVALVRHTGAFDTIETLDSALGRKRISPTDRSFRAVSFQIGWSGPFSGVSLPWQ